MSDQPTPRPHKCKTCKQDHLRCLGHNKRGGPCGQQPIDGCDVCRTHGAEAPQTKAAAKKRVGRARAQRAVATYGLAQDIDPFDALWQEIARTNGHVLWLAEIVAELTTEDLVWGRTLSHTASEIGSGTGQREGNTTKQKAETRFEAQPNIWLELYRDERKHLVHVCAEAIRCGLAEREVKLAEEQGRMLAKMWQAVSNDKELGFDEETKTKFRKVVSRHLRVVA